MAITVNQIAEKCGVSRTTVLRALNGGSVSKETKERILQVAKDIITDQIYLLEVLIMEELCRLVL